MAAPEPESPVQVDVWQRTSMAAERTWLAWGRTALAATARAPAVGRLAPEARGTARRRARDRAPRPRGARHRALAVHRARLRLCGAGDHAAGVRRAPPAPARARGRRRGACPAPVRARRGLHGRRRAARDLHRRAGWRAALVVIASPSGYGRTARSARVFAPRRNPYGL